MNKQVEGLNPTYALKYVLLSSRDKCVYHHNHRCNVLAVSVILPYLLGAGKR